MKKNSINILVIAIFLALVMIVPSISATSPMLGAYWQNNYLYDHNGVPVLSSYTNNYLKAHSDVGIEVTTSPSPVVNKKTGKITYPQKDTYRFGYFPKDFDTRKATYKNVSTFGLSGPVITKDGGNSAAYVIMGRSWPASLPTFKKVVMSLKDDSLLTSTGMNKAKALDAIASAEYTWNNATNQKPFAVLVVLTTKANWKLDGENNMAFTPYATGCTALAATGVWYKTQGIPAGQTYPIVESDMTFNSNLKWTCDPAKEPSKLDFQSAVLHELGHTIGLGDLYNKVAFKTDTRQVMHYYTGVKRTLGNGDATGVWKLYG